jgi:hypothetical protein
MRIFLTVLFFSFSLSLSAQKVADFSNRLYFLAPEIDSLKCEVFAECDCCSDEICFLNNTQFIRLFYCLHNNSATSGTYKVLGNKLLLVYKGKVVTKIFDEDYYNKNNGTKGKYSWETASIGAYTDTISISFCNNSLKLTEKGEEILYGEISRHNSYKEALAELKKEGFWKRLGFK